MKNNVTDKHDEQPVNDNNNQQVPKVEIEIKRHQQLFELLSEPKRMWRVLLSMFLLIVILFMGIAFVVIAIKKYYPYNVIETNIQGATIMKAEDKEVIYWLFNTADLWANSGIEVEEGDELTIRASGAFFTAIHHLVDASKENYKPEDEWVGTEGQRKEINLREKLRAEYRINKNYDEGILLMQIVPNSNNGDGNWKSLDPKNLKDGRIEVIGKERRNLQIGSPGVLHFAVNDIVLTDSVLDGMYKQWIDSLANHKYLDEKKKEEILANLWDIKKMMSLNNSIFNDSLKKQIKKEKIGLALGHYPQIKGDTSGYKAYPLVNELVYYKQNSFRDAWFIDNLGSFLIVIERKKK